MRKTDLKSIIITGVIFIAAIGSIAAAEESNNHAVLLDSVEVSAGESFVLGLSIMADRIDPDEVSGKEGVGSFCIPMKYNRDMFVVDSVVFINTLSKWDEAFTNPKTDTGFISLAGIYDMGGKDNPTMYNPGKPERSAEIYFSASKKAKPGIYKIELTRDPRQGNIYLGSSLGVKAVVPKFKSGIVVIK